MEETRREKGGREEPKNKTSGGHLVDKRLKIYYAGQTVDEQTTRKLKSNSVEESERPRQNRQEPRDENRRENVRWEESLNVQNVQWKRGESVGGTGQ